MAASRSGDGLDQSTVPLEPTIRSRKVILKYPRRQVTLFAITILLNVLLWASFICLATTIYQIAARPDDTTNISSEVLVSTSALATIAYSVLHTIFSLKQRIWRRQRRDRSMVQKTSYIAVRMAVSLCVLWLLTNGWNMITVARQPICLSAGPGRLSWEAGPTCYAGRVGFVFAMVALVASCTLFWMLSVVHRPFEAHLLRHGYRPPRPSPSSSRKASPSRSTTSSENPPRGRVSASTHRSTPSQGHSSHADVDTFDMVSISPPPSIYAPSPRRTIGLGIFTADGQPPPVPPTFALPRRTSSIDQRPIMLQHSISDPHLARPPRMSVLVAPSGFLPLSTPPQFSASAWRAVHPLAPSPLGPVASRSFSHLPHTTSTQPFTYRTRYARSSASVSLTRPHHLSSVNSGGSEGWSSRSDSTGPYARSSEESGPEYKPAPNHSMSGIRKGANLLAATSTKSHTRHISAPDASAAVQQDHSQSHTKKSVKVRPKGQTQRSEPHALQMPRSHSAGVLLSSRFSPDTSPDDEHVNHFEKALDSRLIRKIQSADPLRYSPSPPLGASSFGRGSTESRAEEGGCVGAGA